MISGITGGKGVVVSNNYTSFPYIPSNQNNPLQGTIRIQNNSLQAFDGTAWISFGGAFPTVELDGSAQAAINWAMQKMNEEAEWKRLAESHPAVKSALNDANEAFDKVRVLATLCKEENAQVR
jgi:hypothetical protein